MKRFGFPARVWRVSAGGLFFVFAFVGASNFFALRELAASAPETTRFPLVSICGAAWDDDHDVVLVALCELSRVQAYTKAGDFQYSWAVPGAGDRFSFEEVSNGVYRLRIPRGHRVLYSDGRGRLLTEPVAASAEPRERSAAITAEVIKNPLWARVRILQNGSEIAVVGPSLEEWLLRVPFPTAFYLIAAFLLLRRASPAKTAHPSAEESR